MSDDPDLRDLREYFAGRLPERLREIEEAWERTRTSGWDAQPLKVFHRLVHSLAGAGTTFGFPAVTDASRVLEKRLKKVLDGAAMTPAPAPAPAAADIEELLERLRRAASPAPPA